MKAYHNIIAGMAILFGILYLLGIVEPTPFSAGLWAIGAGISFIEIE